MKERRSRRNSQGRRIERILDAIGKNPAISNEELEKIAIRKEKIIGDWAESRGICVLSTLNEVRMVLKASPKEDARKIDLWVFLNKDFCKDYKFKKIPVQVKSSEGYAQEAQVELDQRREREGKVPIIVLNCGKRVSDENIVSDFIERVKVQVGIMLTKNP